MFLRILLCCFTASIFLSCKKDDAVTPNQPPVASIAWGSTTNDITVKATYSDPDGTITSMQFTVYKDGQLYRSSPWTSSIPTSPMQFANVVSLNDDPGNYSVYLDVTDNKNATTRSNTLTTRIY